MWMQIHYCHACGATQYQKALLRRCSRAWTAADTTSSFPRLISPPLFLGNNAPGRFAEGNRQLLANC